MKNTKQLGKTIGILLIVVITTGIPSTLFRGLSTSFSRSPEFLETLANGKAMFPFVVLLSFIASLAWLIIVALVFPVMKKYNYSMTLLFMGLWILCFSMSLYGDVVHLSLFALAKEAGQESIATIAHFKAFGFLKVQDYIWAHFITLVLYTSATLIFFYYLYKTKLVPRLLSVWGLVAVGVVFIASWLNIFGLHTGEYPFMHNGVHMIVLTIWLTIKGFKQGSVSTTV